MKPADQRFRARHPTFPGIDQRLVSHFQFAARDRLAKVLFQGIPLAGQGCEIEDRAGDRDHGTGLYCQ
jgi:hypothetical protein